MATRKKQTKKPVAEKDKLENALRRIFQLVRNATGHDFSNYKRNTIRRRIERRMAVHQIDDIIEYIRFLNENDWLRIRIAPYRTTENIIDGVVITVFDISGEKHAQQYAESIVETISQPLLILGNNLKVISANKAFYKKFNVNPDNTERKYLYHLGNRQWDIPRLRELLEEILPKNKSFENFEVEHEFPGIGKKKMLLNARQIREKDEDTQRILLAIEDITAKE